MSKDYFSSLMMRLRRGFIRPSGKSQLETASLSGRVAEVGKKFNMWDTYEFEIRLQSSVVCSSFSIVLKIIQSAFNICFL